MMLSTAFVSLAFARRWILQHQGGFRLLGRLCCTRTGPRKCPPSFCLVLAWTIFGAKTVSDQAPATHHSEIHCVPSYLVGGPIDRCLNPRGWDDKMVLWSVNTGVAVPVPLPPQPCVE
jgi:hypothetical protein